MARKESKLYQVLILFLTFLKVGAFTFGGGYAMIPIIQKEVVEKRKWANDNDILDILAISESTPGPISVNTATYIGFKVAGFWGSFFATLGLILPSFIIIYIISLFYETFMQLTIVQAAFKGLKVGVIILLVNAVIKLNKAIKRNAFSITIFVITLITMLSISICKPFMNPTILAICNRGSLILIAFGLIVGLINGLLNQRKESK
ncbi:MAG: chromate transporter [Bacilli bacterium]|nr:chromate transporter [Bacilli bacterium]